MNTPEVITAIAAPCLLAAFALFAYGVRSEWWAPSFSLSLRFIPAHKRKPKTPVELVNVTTVVPPAIEKPAAVSAQLRAGKGIAG